MSIDDSGLSLSFNKSDLISVDNALRCHVSCPSQPPPVTCECGLANRRRRIVGGSASLVHEFPWQVALVDPDHINSDEQESDGFVSGFLCGGVLLSKDYVLTAAHCLYGSPPEWTNVVVGDHDISTMDETKGSQVHAINTYHVHPMYNSTNTDHDLAIIELMNPIDEYTAKMRPICLPSTPSNHVEQLVVTGWGSRSENSSNDVSPVLQKVILPTVSSEECQRQLRLFYSDFVLTPNMMCAGIEQGGKDACFGDSGGPAVAVAGHPDHYELVGITSFGRGCARPNSPGVYADVFSMLDWITEFVPLHDPECPQTFN